MSILDTIVAQTRLDLATSKALIPPERLERRARTAPPVPSFSEALRDRPGEPPRVISELKRASPSKGLIRKDFPVLSLALELERSGAAALSVLTETHWFLGTSSYLRAVAANVSIPVLRKDFIVDDFQVYKARAWGASAVLLIAAALEPAEMARLHALATEIGLETLIEVHNERELDSVLELGPRVVGVNSRDLKTFRTDLAVVERMLTRIPDTTVKVAESGIHGPEDLRRMRAAGADAFLIGELLMRAERPGEKLQELLAP